MKTRKDIHVPKIVNEAAGKEPNVATAIFEGRTGQKPIRAIPHPVTGRLVSALNGPIINADKVRDSLAKRKQAARKRRREAARRS